jgi:hypothetical protein
VIKIAAKRHKKRKKETGRIGISPERAATEPEERM